MIAKIYGMLILCMFVIGCDGTTGNNSSDTESDFGSDTDTDTDSDTDSDTDTDTDSGTDTTDDTATDTESGNSDVCLDGIPNNTDTVCCPESCGACGGTGCSAFPGGVESCCSGPITDSMKYCDENPPPCIIGSAPVDTDSSIDTGSDTVISYECNTTGDCVKLYNSATDCMDSQSAQSWCLCGTKPCKDGGFTGKVLWYGDPDKKLTDVFYRFDTHGNTDPTGDMCVDDPNAIPVASTVTDPVYGKHWRIWKPESRKRAEFARTNGLVPAEGDEWFYGWRWKITSPDNINSGMAVYQWKSDAGSVAWPDTQNYPFNMSYNGTELAITAFGPGDPDWTEGSSITNRATTIWNKNVSKGTWVTILFHVKVSRDPKVGFIEFWFNGEQQTLKNSNFKEYQVVLSRNNTRAYHKTLDSNEVYMKWGAYGQGACDLDVTVNFDEMRVATTYNLVADNF